MTILMRVDGMAECARALKQLAPNIAARQLRKPVATAAKLIQNTAQNKIAQTFHKYSTGRLAQATIIKRDTKVPQTVARYIVAVRHGKKAQAAKLTKVETRGNYSTNLDAFYWVFLEFGTVKYAPHPFLRPAFEEKKTECVGVIAEGIKEGVTYEATRLRWGSSPRRSA